MDDEEDEEDEAEEEDGGACMGSTGLSSAGAAAAASGAAAVPSVVMPVREEYFCARYAFILSARDRAEGGGGVLDMLLQAPTGSSVV